MNAIPATENAIEMHIFQNRFSAISSTTYIEKKKLQLPYQNWDWNQKNLNDKDDHLLKSIVFVI